MRTKVVDSTVLGKVTIAGLRMSQRFSLMEAAEKDDKLVIVEMLHLCVVDEEGNALKTVKEWDIFGGDNFEDALLLFKACKDFNNFSGKQAEKK